MSKDEPERDNKERGCLLGRRVPSCLFFAIAVLFLLCIIAVNIPGFSRGPLIGNERSAIESLQNIRQRQAVFLKEKGRLAEDLQELADSLGVYAEPDSIPVNVRKGYAFTMEILENNTFTVSAVPEEYDVTGSSVYFLDATGQIHRAAGPDPATAADPVVEDEY